MAIKESDLTILVMFHYTSLSIGTNAKFASNNLIDSCTVIVFIKSYSKTWF